MEEIIQEVPRPGKGWLCGGLLVLGFLHLMLLDALVRDVVTGLPVPWKLWDWSALVGIMSLIDFWLLMEVRRVWAVQVDTEGVRGLRWRFALGVVPIGLIPFDWKWSGIARIGESGCLIHLQAGDERAIVNTFAFRDPKAVWSFTWKMFVESRAG